MSTPDNEALRQNRLLTAREAASYLRVGRATVWRWCQQGVIPAFRVGRTWRIRQSDLIQLYKQMDSEDDESPLSK